MPKFSVIIPVYKVEEYLRECIDSVINQKDFTDFEIILVDDGSPDKCGEICDEYSAKYNFIKTIHQKNSGQSVARNNGMEISSGEYIIFLDSDDYLELNTLNKINQYIISYDSQMVVFNRYDFHENIRYCELPANNNFKFYKNGCDWLDNVLKDKSFWASMCSRAVKRSLLSDNNLKFEDNCIYEDFPVSMMTFLLSKNIVFLYEPLYYYRQRNSSTVHTITDKDTDIIKAIEYFEQQMNNNRLNYLKDNTVLNFMIYGWVLSSSLTRYARVAPFSYNIYRLLKRIMHSKTIKPYIRKIYKSKDITFKFRLSAFLSYYCLLLSLWLTALFCKIKDCNSYNNNTILFKKDIFNKV